MGDRRQLKIQGCCRSSNISRWNPPSTSGTICEYLKPFQEDHKSVLVSQYSNVASGYFKVPWALLLAIIPFKNACLTDLSAPRVPGTSYGAQCVCTMCMLFSV